MINTRDHNRHGAIFAGYFYIFRTMGFEDIMGYYNWNNVE
jgi:hypothetical protein